jgi:hypothetical protein
VGEAASACTNELQVGEAASACTNELQVGEAASACTNGLQVGKAASACTGSYTGTEQLLLVHGALSSAVTILHFCILNWGECQNMRSASHA